MDRPSPPPEGPKTRERPKRIQLSRAKGWRLPEGAVVVSRLTKWGNPFSVTTKMAPGAGISGRYIAVPTLEDAIACFRESVEVDPRFQELIKRELAGHDLACWCALNAPCHADILLEIANG